MAVTIDSLQVEIKANANNVEKSIDSLVASLTKMETAMKGIDSSGVTRSIKMVTSSFKGLAVKNFTIFDSHSKKLVKNFGDINNGARRSSSIINSVANSFSKLNRNTKNTSDIFDKISKSIGKMYQKFFYIRWGLSKLKSSIEDSMDYVETYNYFQASFGQVGELAVKEMGQAGEDSAQAYYDSFSQRARKLTAKLTGWNVDDNGVLSATGSKSLGLNPTKTMNAQAQFAQMASSMGVASEQALKLSNALTMIGADLASVKNENFEDTWGRMASGLVGMSRTLDRYGVNIRNANMETKLAELGIDATVSSLSQADKALLRTIILLDSSRYAWGDLAKTIQSPSNQIRMLASNVKMLGQMLGNLFLPIVAKVLPYINALVVALQRLMVAIAKFFGIDMSKFTSSVGGGSDAVSDILDGAEGLDDALGDANENAKKLKNNLLGVDELNIVSDNDDGGSGLDIGGVNGALAGALDDILGEYESVWEKAFKELEDRIQELADKIQKIFLALIDPIRKAWAKVGEDVIKAWKYALQEVGALLKSIGSDFMEMWAQEKTVKIFENLFNIFKDIGLIIGNLAKNFREAWDENDRGLHIFENLRDIAVGFTGALKEIFDYAVKISETINFAPLLEGAEHLTRAIADNSENIFGIWADMWKRIIDFGAYLVETFIPALEEIGSKVVKGIDWATLRENLNTIMTALEKIAEVILNWVLVALDKLADVVIKFVNGDFIKTLAKDFETLAKSLENAKSIKDVINAIFDFGDSEAKNIIGAFNNIVQKIRKTLTKMLKEGDFKLIGKRLGKLFNTIVDSLDMKAIGDTIGKMIIGLEQIISNALAKINWFKLGQKIGDLLANIHWKEILARAVGIILQAIGGLLSALGGQFLKAPLATALEVAIGLMVITSPVRKLIEKIALELGGKWVVEKIASHFGISLTKGITQATETATATLSKTPLKMDLQMFGGSASGGLLSTIGTIVSKLAGIALAIGGLITAGENFFDMFRDGFDWMNEALMLLGLAIAGVGAVILGAPATVVAVVGAIIATVATLVVVIKDHWEEIKGFFANLGEWLSTNIGQPVEHFFTETIPNAFNNFADKVSTWVTNTKQSFSEWAENVGNTVKGWADNVVDTVGKWATNTENKLKEWNQNAKNAIASWFDETKQKFDTWRDNVERTIREWSENVQSTVREWSGKVVNQLKEWKQNATDSIRTWFDETKGKFETWSDSVKRTVQDWKDTCSRHFDEWKTNVVNTLSSWAEEAKGRVEEFKEKAENFVTTFKDNTQRKFEEWKTNVSDTLENWKTEAKAKIEDFKTKAEGFIETFRTTTQQKFETWKTTVLDHVENFRKNAQQKISDFRDKAGDFLEKFKNESSDKIEKFKTDTEGKMEKWKTNISTMLTKFKDEGINTVKAFVTGCQEWFQAHHWTFDGIKQGLGQAFDNAMSWVKSKWADMKSWFSNLDFSFGWNGDYYSGRSYGTYATGGFPEDGWFRASHGELMGKFDNGQSVVANNQQIIAGIEGGVERAVANTLAPYLSQIADNTLKTANKNQSVVIDGREIVTAYDNRKARNGFSFT